MVDEAITCSKCGHDMQPLPLTESTLGDVVEVDFICPNCLHIEHVIMLVVDKED